jgi:hypothetical protein
MVGLVGLQEAVPYRTPGPGLNINEDFT